jgi:RecB family exonuclease
MRRHRISADIIDATVRTPEWEEPPIAGRVNRWKRIADRFVRVTCRDEPARIVVISAVFERRGPRETQP